MSNSIEVPEPIITRLTSVLCSMSFEKLLSLFLKGACRHTSILGVTDFELEAVKLECVALDTYRFTFQIVHECLDERGSWVVDKTIEAVAVGLPTRGSYAPKTL
jgi:hypothetical protein